jgi:predicted nucleic acid-binding protein
MTLVVDASTVVAALVDVGPVGGWARDRLDQDDVAAPHLMPAEAASALRRADLSGELTSHAATLAHADLLDLPLLLFPYRAFAERIWHLRKTVTAYDAWYVALAESLDAKLATLDTRLAAAPGPLCGFVVPP